MWAVALFLPVLFYAGAIHGALLWDALSPTEKEDPRLGRPGWVPPAPGMHALVDLAVKLRETTIPRGSGFRLGLNNHRLQWEAYEDMERGLIPDDAVAIVRQAGIAPYYLPDLTFVDYYGLNDWVIARNPVARPNSERRLAHDRRPPPGYLEERGVNFGIFHVAPSVGAALSVGAYAIQFAPGLWMPFDAPSRKWVEARFDSFVTTDDLQTFALRSGRLLADSEFDVYDAPASDSPISGGRRTLVFVREPCAEEDVRDAFFLRVRPLDENDLPEDRRRHGFEKHTFAFDAWGSRRNGRCITVRHLPDYPIASIRAGQFTAHATVWESVFQFVVTDDAVALLESARLLASSQFDVYEVPASDSPVSGGRRTLTYVREPCAEEDVSAKFFLHINPVDENDLPEDRREWRFDNLDFVFAEWGLREDERCVAFHPLPDYPIASVATGQFTERGEVWIAEFALPDGGRG